MLEEQEKTIVDRKMQLGGECSYVKPPSAAKNAVKSRWQSEETAMGLFQVTEPLLSLDLIFDAVIAVDRYLRL